MIGHQSETFDIAPELATLVETPPVGDEWIHEAKLDGYRTLAYKTGKEVRFITRNGNDWTTTYLQLAQELETWKEKSFVLDGEIVALDENGIPDFNLLQNSIGKKKVRKNVKGLVFYAFDLLSFNGKDLRRRPLLKRKEMLRSLLEKEKCEHFKFSEHFESQNSSEILQEMCRLGLEGVVSKLKDSPYLGGRTKNWLKTKCIHTEEFIIIGYRTGTDHEIGSLLVGAYHKGKLKFEGKVGTGFSKTIKNDLWKKFKPLINKTPTVDEQFEYENIVWLKPELIAEVQYLNKTNEGLRHVSFLRLRPDKNTEEVTAPQHVTFPELNITRDELKDYYRKVFPLMLPYLRNRLLNLYICRGGIHGQCEFLRRVDSEEFPDLNLTAKSKGHFWMDISNRKGLEQLLSMNTVEFHTWGSISTSIDKPDMIVMDIDASTEISLQQVKECALALREIFSSLGLESFIKTTGGKGYHIHVPIAPIYTWNEIHEFSHSISRMLAMDFPELYTDSTSLQKRRGRIFIDYLRNHAGGTSVAPYSLRAKDRATLAVPISWKDLGKISPVEFTIHDLGKLLKRKDPWTKMYKLKQKISLFTDR